MQKPALPKNLEGLRALETQLKDDLARFRNQNSSPAVTAGIEARIRTVQTAIRDYGKAPETSHACKEPDAPRPMRSSRTDLMAAANALFR